MFALVKNGLNNHQIQTIIRRIRNPLEKRSFILGDILTFWLKLRNRCDSMRQLDSTFIFNYINIKLLEIIFRKYTIRK